MLPLAITIPSPAVAISLLASGVKDYAVGGFIFQPDDGATNPMFIGFTNVNGTTIYMIRLNAPAGGVPPAPVVIIPGGGTSLGMLSQYFVIGTAGEILRGAVIPR